MAARCILAYDVGTSGVKAVVTDLKGRILGSDYRPYGLTTLPGGWVEQPVESILAGLYDATAGLLSRHHIDRTAIDGIGVTGQMFNLVAVDRRGDPLAPMINWLDLRSTTQANALAARMPAGEQFRRLGALITAKDVIPKMLWLREERPDLWARTAKLLDCKEAVVLSLTGASIIDHAGATAFRLVDQTALRWDEETCADLELPVTKLPEIGPATGLAGGLTRAASRRLGLRPGTPVVVGSGDVGATQIGAGATEPGDAHLSLGTAGYWGITLAERVTDPAEHLGVLAHMDPAKWILWLEIATAGGALAWFLRTLGDTRPSHAEIDQLVVESADDPPIFAPWLSGERVPVFDDEARAAFIGLDLHHRRGHLLRAIMEGVAFQIRLALEYGLAFGCPIDEIRAVGGGSISDIWLQIISDVIARPLLALSNPQDAGARGAAACAIVGLGLEPDFSFAKGESAIQRSLEPAITRGSPLEDRYTQFRGLYDRLAPLHQA